MQAEARRQEAESGKFLKLRREERGDEFYKCHCRQRRQAADCAAIYVAQIAAQLCMV